MQVTEKLASLSQTWTVGFICFVGLLLVWGVTRVNTSALPIAEIGLGVEVLEDVQNQFGIDTIRLNPELNWQIENDDKLSYGMANHPIWFKFNIGPKQNSGNRLLEIDYAMLDKVDIWFYEKDRVLAQYHEGDSYPFSHREIESEKLLFAVPASTESITVFMKVQTTGTLKVPMRLWEERQYMIYNGEHNLALGLFFGFMAAMALSNLFFWVTTGSPMFLTYSMYVVFMALTLTTMHGIAFKYIWPDGLWLQSRSIGICATLTILFATIFSNQLLNVKTHSVLMYRLMRYSAALLFCAFISSLILPYALYIKIFLLLICVAVSLIFATGVVLLLKGIKLARFYLLAWTALLLSGFISSLESSDIIQLEYGSHYLLMYGAIIETFMLALALAIAYTRQRDELFKTQELALLEERMARAAQEDTLELKEQAQEELEYKVQERTLELEVTLRELSDTNRELERQTLTDALTGIRNRQHFDRKYHAEVRRSRRERTELSVVMLDIDHFKSINDTYGHVSGDEVIKFAANLLKQNLKRTSDEACRYGGEEFALILPNTDMEGARQLADSVRKQIESSVVTLPEGDITMTISAGVATGIVEASENESVLLELADKALYEAKRDGRNRVVAAQLNTQSNS